MSVYHVEADGDTARALTYHTCHQAPLEDPAHVTAKIGQYHDELRRDGDVWRIGRREMTVTRQGRVSGGGTAAADVRSHP